MSARIHSGQEFVRIEVPPRKPPGWCPGPSPDGKLILKKHRVGSQWPDLLVFPASHSVAENLCLVPPYGTTRRLTHFAAPW